MGNLGSLMALFHQLKVKMFTSFLENSKHPGTGFRYKSSEVMKHKKVPKTEKTSMRQYDIMAKKPSDSSQTKRVNDLASQIKVMSVDQST